MKFNITITKAKLVDEFPEHWSSDDYRQLLEAFDFEDAAGVADTELREMLFLAMSDLEPDESARIVLNYKLGDALNEGQIDQISHEMLQDKISEEYADINYHHELFHVNQLLYKGYNGCFPNAKASIIEFELKPLKNEKADVDKSFALRALSAGISDRAVIKRLFDDQLAGEKEFPEAEAIIWEFKDLGDDQYRLITSEYWLDQSDFEAGEFESIVELED
ncbi:MAG TPA: hypothetical protein ENH91_01820 [Leeuwenhoekiella sp.]|nr:hypothetical protein [Leeuwenhoekiella sp.]